MAKSRNTGGVVLAMVIVAAVAAISYYAWQKRTQKPPEFTTTTIAKGEIVQTVTATGDLEPVTSVDISSQISGLITELLVDYNSPVKQGQVLARIDPATYDSRLRQAQAELANTEANSNLVRLNTNRTRELRKRELVSQQDLDQADALLAQAQAQSQIQKAAVENAKVDLSRCTIVAPIDGIVIDRQVDVGKTVAASLNAPTLFTIANDLTSMEINTSVAEADIGAVEVGQSVNFTVDAYPGRQFYGKVSQIRNSPKTLQNVVVYATIIDVRNGDLKLKPGMTANVAIVVARRDNVTRVSNGALRVRVPESIKVLPAVVKGTEATSGTANPPPKVLTEDERRTALRDIMQEAGFVRGNGPPSPEVIQRMQQLAKAKGIEMDLARFGQRRDSNSSASPATPVVRTVYKLATTDPAHPQLQAVAVKLGVTDGLQTEVLDGLNEGDQVVTSITTNNSSSSAPTSNPFSPGGLPRRF